MKTIEKVSLEKVSVNWSSNKMNIRIVTFTDGAKIKVESLLREIGNLNLDNWNNISKISKSSSDKNISNYLNNFINKLEICK